MLMSGLHKTPRKKDLINDSGRGTINVTNSDNDKIMQVMSRTDHSLKSLLWKV